MEEKRREGRVEEWENSSNGRGEGAESPPLIEGEGGGSVLIEERREGGRGMDAASLPKTWHTHCVDDGIQMNSSY